MQQQESSSRTTEAESALLDSWGPWNEPDEVDAKRLAVLRQRAEQWRERLSCVPFHARKVAMLKAEGRDEMEYWIGLVPQRVDPDEMA